MEEILTRDEIYNRYPGEWVLIGEPQVDAHNHVQAGKVLFHSKDRDEMYGQAIALRPPRFATLYTGRTPADIVLVV